MTNKNKKIIIKEVAKNLKDFLSTYFKNDKSLYPIINGWINGETILSDIKDFLKKKLKIH
jgi:hypothetical protein